MTRANTRRGCRMANAYWHSTTYLFYLALYDPSPAATNVPLTLLIFSPVQISTCPFLFPALSLSPSIFLHLPYASFAFDPPFLLELHFTISSAFIPFTFPFTFFLSYLYTLMQWTSSFISLYPYKLLHPPSSNPIDQTQ